jgi:hypothetical protein
MAFRYSPQVLFDFANNELKTAFANGSIAAYTGAQPADVSLAPTGTFLGRFTLAGGAWAAGSPTNGLNFATPVADALGAIMTKSLAEEWRFVCSVAGTIGWCRFVANPADPGAVSLTHHRIDLSVGVSSGDLQIPKLTYAVGEVAVVSSCVITLRNVA